LPFWKNTLYGDTNKTLWLAGVKQHIDRYPCGKPACKCSNERLQPKHHIVHKK